MDETDTTAHAAERRLLTDAPRESTGAIVLPEGGVEFVALTGSEDAPGVADSLAGLDWRDYESAVRTPGGGGR